MSGSVQGGLKTAETVKKKYGSDYYVKIGAKGGRNGKGGGFASAKLGSDGMTGPERASKYGVIGGRISRRPKKVA